MSKPNIITGPINKLPQIGGLELNHGLVNIVSADECVVDERRMSNITDMYAAFVDYKDKRNSGDIVFDTAGADYFFIIDFITDDMENDFQFIEKDFMSHCYDKLHEFAKVKFCEHNEVRHSTTHESHRTSVMNMILNGVRLDDAYCKNLLHYLFKTYHKPLYNQFKRFNKITYNEIVSLAQIDAEKADPGIIAIILTMCGVNNVELEDQCYIFYQWLNMQRERFEKQDEESIQDLAVDPILFLECLEKVLQWSKDTTSPKATNDAINEYAKGSKFVDSVLNYFGYPYDYIDRYADIEEDNLSEYLATTLFILSSACPDDDFTLADIQVYMHLYMAIEALAKVSDDYNKVNDMFFGATHDDLSDGPKLFNAEKISTLNTVKPVEDKKAPVVTTVIANNSTNDDYIAEIDSLCKKLNQRNMDYDYLKSQYSSLSAEKKRLEGMLAAYENDRTELIALRDYVYSLKSDTSEFTDVSVDDMRKIVEEKNYVIIGGHDNWIKKIKNEFPNWTCILPNQSRTVDTKVLENSEKVFFFTDHLDHSTYNKYINVLREQKIPFSYLHGVNLDQIVRQIYDNQ